MMSNKGTPPKPSIVTPGPGLRLDSTKEIANYLKRSPRTVHRWEREEGLPVHRHQHRKKGTLYAYASEIDAWLKSRVKEEVSCQGPGSPKPGLAPVVAEIAKLEFSSVRPILIAVLPLRNITQNPAREPFADALTDEVISELGQLSPKRLRVIAYTTVAHYKQSGKTVTEIGRELGVDYVLEGGVRWYGRQVRMTARLIAVHDQAQVWTGSFETQLPPLFAVQQALARELAGALSTELRLPATRKPRPETTCSPAAHNAYLSGTRLFQWSEPDIKKGLDFFSRAVELDPNCAPSYAELALAWFRLGFLYDYPPAATLRSTRELARKAVALDPELCRSHVAMAAWNLYGAWNWSEAEASSRRAVEINPSDGPARMLRASCQLVLHRPDEAAEDLRQALRLDPQSSVIGAWLAILGFLARSYDSTIEGCQELLSHDASLSLVHAVLGDCFAQKGDCARAITHVEKARALSQGQTIYTASLSSVYALAGRQTAAERLVQELLTLTEQQYVRYIYLALAAVNLGNNERTLEWLEKAHEQHDPFLVFLKSDPRFEALSRLGRFRNLLGRIGLPS